MTPTLTLRRYRYRGTIYIAAVGRNNGLHVWVKVWNRVQMRWEDPTLVYMKDVVGTVSDVDLRRDEVNLTDAHTGLDACV